MLDKISLVQVCRSKKRLFLYSLLLSWLFFINLWIYYYRNDHRYKSIDGSIYDTGDGQTALSSTVSGNVQDQDNENKNEILNHSSIQALHRQSGIEDIRKIDSHSSNYDKIFQDHDINGILSKLTFQERCDLYFNNLFTTDINWKIDPDKELPLEWRHSFSFDKFRNDIMGRVKEKYAEEKQLNKDTLEINQEIEDRIKSEYKNFWNKSMKTEQIITDYISHLRIFNKCFVTADNQLEAIANERFISKQFKFIKALTQSPDKDKSFFKQTLSESLLNTDSFDSCQYLESRIYPWLSFNFPIYQRWTGEIVLSPPDMSKYVKSDIVFEPTNKKAHFGKGNAGKIKSKLTKNKACFLNRFKNSINGKGIVLSIGDAHVSDTVRLIHLLRALNNKYPIQIVYYDGLSENSKQQIIQAAREQFTALPKSFEKVSKYFPDDYLDPNDNGLPKQEVWFVNAHSVIHDSYKKKFEKFANKFLAALFNSFEEYILIDADTVMTQNPEFFFNLKGYKWKGAYFYKDRTAPEFRPESDTKFFTKISPSIVDSVMFDIPIITKYTLSLDFFDGMGHFMESGLVVIDRNLHFNSILMMIQLNFFGPVTTRVYGDKEIFWLAFAINGDENYQFNKYFAAAIGEETPAEDRLNKDGKPKVSREICSAHPGHINGEDSKSLVWFNSGFKFCGQSEVVDYEKEFEHKSRLKFLNSVSEMKTFFKNQMTLKHAIVPPFKNKLETLCENLSDEPKEGWVMDRGYCNSYLWCAYSSIGGKTNDGGDNTQVGQFFEFDTKATDLFSYYGDIWVGNE